MSSVWLADWSDEEDVAFRAAAAQAGARVEVLRTAPLGTSVGSAAHRLRSYPAYASLAVRGLRLAKGRPLVAWQPLAGSVVGLLRRAGDPGLVVLNPILSDGPPSRAQRIAVSGLRRAERVVVYARSARAQCVAAGLDPARVLHVPLGVTLRPDVPPPDPAAPLLAAGRDHRDWATLAAAAARARVEVLVAGPAAVPAPLRLVQPGSKAAFLDLLDRSAGLVVPLVDDRRQAGTLAVLDGLAAGRPVVATRGPGTEDYLADGGGILVAPGDVEALSTALIALSDPAASRQAAAQAREAGRRFGLDGFVAAVGRVADDAARDRRRRH